jgi:hypothetical protein
MPRSLIAIALYTLVVPALAAAQHPAASARPHPAASAHANAIAGQADALRLEACGQATRRFIDQLSAGDFEAATANFDAAMRTGLGANKLAEVWKSIGARLGKLEARGTAQNVMYRDMPVASMPLHFEKGALVAQLVCARDGKFAGFHLQPLPSAAPAASAP